MLGRLPGDGNVPLPDGGGRLHVVDVHAVLVFFVGRWVLVGFLFAGEELIAIQVLVVVVARQREDGRSVEGGR